MARARSPAVTWFAVVVVRGPSSTYHAHVIVMGSSWRGEAA